MAPQAINYAGMNDAELLQMSEKARQGITNSKPNSPMWDYWYEVQDRIASERLRRAEIPTAA